MKLSWENYKSIIDNKKLLVQHIESESYYKIFSFDGQMQICCDLYRDPSDTTDLLDFENNYKLNSNSKMIDVDTQGRQVTRFAAAKSGWTYRAHTIEIETSLLASLYSKDYSGTDISGITLKFYNSSDVELTTQGTIDTDCVKTEVLFAPSFDYELIGGDIRHIEPPASSVRVWVVGGIIELGGVYVREMVTGVNLYFLGADEVIHTDGRASKYMTKDIDGVPYQGNQLKFIIKHTAGYKHKLMLVLEYFRS